MVPENMGERRRSDCSFRIRPPWRGLKSYMFRGIPLWLYHPIPYKRAAAPVAELLKMDNGPQRTKSKMPEAPFCSVALTKHLEDARNREMLKWVGDYEGCAAVAWLYGDMIWDDEEFKVKTKAKDDLSVWLFFGIEKYAPTQETITLFGKRYLEEFVLCSKDAITKNPPPYLFGITAPVLERLDKLKKMLQE